MVVELLVGKLSGSLALTADGWHLAGDVGALTLSSAAYWFARTRARSTHFTFGTGKVQVLAGYTNGVLLTLVSLNMMIESIERLIEPQAIDYTEALAATAFGLAISLGNALLLGAGLHTHDGHPHAPADDHNLRAVYLHVLSDVMTSVLTLLALVIGARGGPAMLDTVVAIFASAIVMRWGIGLCRRAARPLLDASDVADEAVRVRGLLESLPGVEIRDLRVWDLGGGRHGCLVSLSQSTPRQVSEYRELVLATVPLGHLSVEIGGPSPDHTPEHTCHHLPAAAGATRGAEI